MCLMCALPNPNDLDPLPHLKPKLVMSAFQHHYPWTLNPNWILNPNLNDIAPLNFITQDEFKITLQAKILKSLLILPFNFIQLDWPTSFYGCCFWKNMKLLVVSTLGWNYPIGTCFWELLLACGFASFLASNLPLPLPSCQHMYSCHLKLYL